MGKRVTAADVARSLGLSRATVGFVLNDTPGQTISEATRERVLAEAKRLGYRPHTAARALASGRSHIVLLLLPDWPIAHSMQAHLDEAALVLDRAGYSLVTTTPHPDGHAAPLWETLDPDVVVALAPVTDEQFAGIAATRARTIIPGRDTLGTGEELRFEEGPRLQVAHLWERGCHRIAFAGAADPRLAGLALARCELAEATLRELSGDGFADAVDIAGPEGAAEAVARWAVNGIDGVVAYNDDVAALVLGAALRQGIEVPTRLAIVGHDDTPLAALMVPALSSVRVDSAGLGRFVAELALSRATDAAEPLAGPVATVTLVARESS
jgi:DNA-binding LacI/PurR family transcriptional regulator